MAIVTSNKKAVTVNPLKQSQPLGASLAFLGLKGTMPLFHGSQGCTAFAKVLLVRHFREAIPMSTTAMTEVSTILGGEENIEQAILTLVEKAQPEIIGLFTTGLTETRGDDMHGILRSIRQDRPELNSLPIVVASTPDFKGSMQDGFAAAVESIVREIPRSQAVNSQQITILAGSSLMPGDLQEIKEIVADFGLTAIAVPDLSGSLDGHLDEGYSATTSGGTSLEELYQIGSSAFTIAIGESMRHSARILNHRFGTNYQVFERFSGLGPVDSFFHLLSQLSDRPVPEKYRRQRRQLQDAMLDTHFYFGRKRISLALEPDLLYQTACFFLEMGSEIQAAVTTTKSPLLEQLPIPEVMLGDLEDFAELAPGSDLAIGNSHCARIAKKLCIPIYRQGMPIFDRLGNGQRCAVSYRGSMQWLFDIGNILLEAEESHSHH